MQLVALNNFNVNRCEVYQAEIREVMGQDEDGGSVLGLSQDLAAIKMSVNSDWTTCQNKGSLLIHQNFYDNNQRSLLIEEYKRKLGGFFHRVEKIEQVLSPMRKKAEEIRIFIANFPIISPQARKNMQTHNQEGASQVESSYTQNEKALQSLNKSFLKFYRCVNDLEKRIENLYLESMFGFLQTLQAIEFGSDPKGWFLVLTHAALRKLPSHTSLTVKATLTIHLPKRDEIQEDEKGL